MTSERQRWTGFFFDDTTLRNMGLVVSLNHVGEMCPSPSAPTDLVVMDVSGVHTVMVTFCECYHSVGGSHVRSQLLRHRWFPATVARPRTVFTFDVLDSFHLLTLQGKTSAYDYYLSIEHKTDNTGISSIKVPVRTQHSILSAFNYLT
jgi:hypothetical protein